MLYCDASSGRDAARQAQLMVSHPPRKQVINRRTCNWRGGEAGLYVAARRICGARLKIWVTGGR